jgi:hypothetical protein
MEVVHLDAFTPEDRERLYDGEHDPYASAGCRF